MADLKAPLFNADGANIGEVSLDATVFGLEPNIPVMHQVVTAQMAGARSGTASTKTRAEVRGGGRKPWRQKGLGRARHGSIRAPQWTGGGVAFGPKPRDYSQRTPKKMKKLALRSALSARAGEGGIKVVETLDWTEPKTKTAVHLLRAIEADGKVLIVVGLTDKVAERSFRNLPQVVILHPGQLNAYDVLWAETVLFTTDTLGSVTGAGSYDVSDRDFVMEPAAETAESAAGSPSPADEGADAGGEES